MNWKAFFITLLVAICAAAGVVGLRLWYESRRGPIPEPEPDYMADGVLRVCLDPGHGGDDPGAADLGESRLEKHDTLALGLAVRDELNERYPEIDVVITREADKYVPLDKRCIVANESDSDIFVSFHRNSASHASGVEIWCRNDKPWVASQLAARILEGLDGVGIAANRGVKFGTAGNPDGNYYVIANTKMPACLIELGFMTSDQDNELLDANFSAYAVAIADAIATFLLKQ